MVQANKFSKDVALVPKCLLLLGTLLWKSLNLFGVMIATAFGAIVGEFPARQVGDVACKLVRSC